MSGTVLVVIIVWGTVILLCVFGYLNARRKTRVELRCFDHVVEAMVAQTGTPADELKPKLRGFYLMNFLELTQSCGLPHQVLVAAWLGRNATYRVKRGISFRHAFNDRLCVQSFACELVFERLVAAMVADGQSADVCRRDLGSCSLSKFEVIAASYGFSTEDAQIACAGARGTFRDLAKTR